MNKLYYGDNLDVLRRFVRDETVDLCYIDTKRIKNLHSSLKAMYPIASGANPTTRKNKSSLKETNSVASGAHPTTNNKMAQTLVQMFVHVVFSTKNRADMIMPEIESELFAYIGGIAANNNSKLVAANGTANHIHLLVLLSKTMKLSELVGDVKRNSSRWIKSKGNDFKTFGWQDGFAAFSVGQTQVPMVKDYIANQKEKHSRQKFEDDMRMFYDKYGIEYDERYIWD